jgi:DNA-binding NtrC family response regulator
MPGILIIDDEPHMLQLLERIIAEKTAYKTTATNSSLEVPDLLERNSFDLVITDLRMPGLDGLEIIDLVNDRNRWEKVILITAFGSIDVALSAQSKGAFDYITKPFKKEQIVFVIERAMAFQDMRRRLKTYDDMLATEPYRLACERFKDKYVKTLARKYDGDEKRLSEKSGLPASDISAILGNSEQGKE